ncbi:cyclase family protein, partial [Exiguobacterium sp.]|uniref:cyclase family protein n=1 Tax=Exiguobacterium sp. TaxID=44751 RepID=UPI0028A8DE74
MTRWIDVSQPLDRHVATWPGDTPFEATLTWNKEDTGSVNVGKVTMSLHTGTHVDAPFHFDDAGQKIIDLDPDLYIGHTRVIYLPGRTEITAADLDGFELNDVQ